MDTKTGRFGAAALTLALICLTGCGSYDAGGKYGECSVTYNNRDRWNFTCPNQAAFHTAIDNFVEKNPRHKDNYFGYVQR